MTCYAESSDGIRWQKPELGLFEWKGSKKNNIVWRGDGVHNFTPFLDTNPQTSADARYKAVGGSAPAGLFAFQSADGIRWKKLAPQPVFSKGAFDSQNVPFWDPTRRRYAIYYRFFSEGEFKGRRAIGVTHSSDFRSWDGGTPLVYPGAPDHQLYTNQVLPYHRAPHLLIGFPTRYVARPLTEHVKKLAPVELRSTLASGIVRAASDITDGLFMTSRDGTSFRLWSEAFLRPGPEHENRWIYGDNYQSLGLIETPPAVAGGPNELSFYSSEGAWRDGQISQRRYVLRLDGFVSARAAFAGGEILTRPIKFDGNKLFVNYSTSAAGSLKVELQDASGQPLPGFTLQDCDEHYGDSVRQVVQWKKAPDLASFVRPSDPRPVRAARWRSIWVSVRAMIGAVVLSRRLNGALLIRAGVAVDA